MENCLKTQLKEVVNNDNLKKFNVLTIHAEELTSYVASKRYLVLLHSSDITLKTDGNYMSTTESGLVNDPKDEITLSNSSKVFFANGNYDIEVSNKYAITGIENANTGLYFDLTELEYNSLRSLYINEGKTYGNINKLLSNNASTITALTTQVNSTIFYDLDSIPILSSLIIINSQGAYSAVTGNIIKLKDSIKLIQIALNGTGVSGELKDVIAGICNAGRDYTNDPTLNVTIGRSGVKFNGNGYQNMLTVNFTVTGATVTEAGSVIGTYTKATNTWEF